MVVIVVDLGFLSPSYIHPLVFGPSEPLNSKPVSAAPSAFTSHVGRPSRTATPSRFSILGRFRNTERGSRSERRGLLEGASGKQDKVVPQFRS